MNKKISAEILLLHSTGAQCNYFWPIKEWTKQIPILFLNNLLFEKDTGQNGLLICPNCTEGYELVFTQLSELKHSDKRRGDGIFGLTLPKLSPFSFDPFRQLCCGVWEFLATMKITVSQKLAAVQTSTGSILLSGEILILCWEHCVTDWKFFLKISTLYCITEASFPCHWNSVSNHW